MEKYIDEAIEKIADKIMPQYPDISWEDCRERVIEGIKEGAKWMVGQMKQEQSEVDLEKEINKFLNETGAPYVWCNDDEQKEWCNIIARHFAEWGVRHLNARKEE